MENERIRQVLADLACGNIDQNQAFRRIAEETTEDMGFARLDQQREARCGYPEVVYGGSKTAQQISVILSRLYAKSKGNVFATRCSPEKYQQIKKDLPEAIYHHQAAIVSLCHRKGAGCGLVAVLCAGTSDLPVAEEAAVTAELMGAYVERHFDVGVAGIHRLLEISPLLQRAKAVVAVAGMEGALASVVGGLTAAPVIAVPTSIGYGANFGGVA
ncbi:MAG: nickel pincer cofactor biosynthesis protein LarB, partial [Clostridiales bacterium]